MKEEKVIIHFEDKTTKTKQQAAVEFLKWLTDTKQNVQFSKETGYLPVKKEANKVEPLVDNNNNMDTQKVVEVSIDTVKENAMYSPKALNKEQQQEPTCNQ